MKKIIISISLFLFTFVNIAHAEYLFSLEEITAMSGILKTYALGSALIIAAATSIIVFRNARKMRGGVFGKVLNYFGVGMTVVLIGYTIGEYPSLIPIEDVSTVDNALFIIGYILMAIAATKMARAIEGR
ncbi:MAG: hypothetical protein KAR24_00075 [Candidatus Pacebacteria bacterium]|nr:hypothetical protein [Candidatus Paceibacterota bacterium]MCK5591386.1 hypothetical protein [Candidatus Paceibacterota bacterium]